MTTLEALNSLSSGSTGSISTPLASSGVSAERLIEIFNQIEGGISPQNSGTIFTDEEDGKQYRLVMVNGMPSSEEV